ncbi:hypothetical protein M2322_000844 [Rhodoblastus acidophilus]|uniref:hypothetical protein n=1 Tax=Rhodoblastus acidophilus TaxID=1074 RepID=UPI0022257FCE|nr:hypothetical protein [Rhodoblastus acidophilus]MCW2315310.1 hypothetical protein [Rhodoblastus acidophilus]
MQSGQMRHRVKIWRRQVSEDGDRGDYVLLYSSRANAKALNAAKMVEAGLAESGSRILLRIRDCAPARLIDIGCRASVEGPGMAAAPAPGDYEVENVNAPDARMRTIDFVLVQKQGG